MRILMLLSSLVLLTTSVALAEKNTFTGTGDWNDAERWSGGVPVEGDEVVIQGTATLTNPTPALASFDIDRNSVVTCNGWATKIQAKYVTINGTLEHAVNTQRVVTADGRWIPNARVWVVGDTFNLAGVGIIRASDRGWQCGVEQIFKPGNGPGGGAYNASTQLGPLCGQGASYGGFGGGMSDNVRPPTYDTPDEPYLPGSSGGGGDHNTASYGGHGGGAVRIEATGVVTINGQGIAAQSEKNANYHNGGGSGGSVYIRCKYIEGKATISVRGSDGNSQAGGGGGRIAVHYDAEEQAKQPLPSIIFAAGGGWRNTGSSDLLGTYEGEMGTLWFTDSQFLTRNDGVFKHQGRWMAPGLPAVYERESLVMQDACLELPTNTTLKIAGDLVMFGDIANQALQTRCHKLVVRGGALEIGGNLAVTNATLALETADGVAAECSVAGDALFGSYGRAIVHSGETAVFGPYGAVMAVGGDVTVDANAQLQVVAHPTNALGAAFTMRNLAVLAGGALTADFNGYHGTDWNDPNFIEANVNSDILKGFGPAGGRLSPEVRYHASGGGHGGLGGGQPESVPLYDDELIPVMAGSGGRLGSRWDMEFHSIGGHGGGALGVFAESVWVEGTISANGATSGGWNSAGGAGGSILVVAKTFESSETALLVAKGGGATGDMGGGGGGGRIAVWTDVTYPDYWQDFLKESPRIKHVDLAQEQVFAGTANVDPGQNKASGAIVVYPTVGTVRFLAYRGHRGLKILVR